MTFSTASSHLQLQSLQDNLLHRITNRIRQSLQLQEILQTTVAEIRAFLEIDRVMVYRFHADEHGEVIAEAIHNHRLPTLLGLHFPADDIPLYARELFLQARQRSIVDLSTQQIGWSTPHSVDSVGYDFADIHYRSIDPCHIEYLQAMGVQSSVVVPILQADQLWGLLVAHHSEPRTVTEAELHLLQLVVDQVIIAIAQSALLAQVQAQADRERIANNIATLLHCESANSFEVALQATVEAIGGSGGRLFLMSSASGQPSELYTCGIQPIVPNSVEDNFLEHYPLWQATLSPHQLVITDLYQDSQCLSLQEVFRSTPIRSLLIIPLHQGSELVGYLTLFRNEIDTEVVWAGKVDLNGRQTIPRQSFERWRQQKTGQAQGWTDTDLNLVQVIKNHFGQAIRQYQLQVQVQALNARLERQVQQQSNLLQNVIDSSTDWIFVKDLNFRYLLANPTCAAAIGRSPEEMVGKDDLELGFLPEQVFGNPEQGIVGFRAGDQKAIAGESVFNRADPATVANGSVIWVETKKLPLRDHEGRVFGVLGVCRDVTERKQAEVTLQEQLNLIAFRADVDASLTRSEMLQEMLRYCTEAMVRHLDAAFARIWLLNPQENVLELQASSGIYTHLNGAHARVPVGKFKIGLIAQERQPHLTNSVLDDPRVGDKVWAKRENMVAFAGYPLMVENQLLGVVAMFARQPLSSSTLEALALVSQEIALGIKRQYAEMALRQSEIELRHKAEQLEQTLRELQHTQAQLVQTEKMSSLGQLVAGVAHEINNPVNFIYGNLTHAETYAHDLLNLLDLYQQHYSNPVPAIQAEAEVIDLNFLKADLPKLLSSMKVGTDRIQKIVVALRNFSRMDEAEVKAVNLHDGIDSTLMILQNRLKETAGHPGIQVIKNYGDLPLIECYAGQLNQVFMNILSNAIDALDEFNSTCSPEELKQHPATIVITTEQMCDRYLQIRITDNGLGMSRQVQQRLFEPFFTTKPVGKGTGLGLSISYQVVVDKHGGALTCHSTPGKGTEFVIELPFTLKG